MKRKLQEIIWQLQKLYVKCDAFWDKLPSPVKVPVYQALSAGALLLAQNIANFQISVEEWKAIVMLLIANEGIVISNYLRQLSLDISGLKEKYNQELMDR